MCSHFALACIYALRSKQRRAQITRWNFNVLLMLLLLLPLPPPMLWQTHLEWHSELASNRASEHPFDITEFLIYLYSLWLFPIQAIHFFILPFFTRYCWRRCSSHFSFIHLKEIFLLLNVFSSLKIFGRYIIAATFFSPPSSSYNKVRQMEKKMQMSKTGWAKMESRFDARKAPKNNGWIGKIKKEKTFFELNLLSLFISKQYYINIYQIFRASLFQIRVKYRCCFSFFFLFWFFYSTIFASQCRYPPLDVHTVYRNKIK